MKRLAAVGFDWILDNPVINKELRGRMRGTRAYWLLLGYLLVLSIAMFLAYLAWSQSVLRQSGSLAASFTIGRELFTTIFMTQACLIALIMPALTSGAITIEHEQRTFEMVRCTTLRPASIVLGKLVSSVSFVALMLTCALPLVSICFLLGGVAPDEVISAYAMLMCDAFLFGAAGIACSACMSNTAGATALTYATMAGYFVITLVPSLAEVAGHVSAGLSALNPIGAVDCASAIEHYFGWSVPAWVPGLIVNGLLACLLCLVAINRLEDFPARRATWLRITTFAFAAALVFFCDGAVAFFVGFSGPDILAVLGCVGLVAAVLFCPIFATGDPADDNRALMRRSLSFNPVTAFREASLRTGLITSVVFAVMLTVETLLALHAAHVGTRWRFPGPWMPGSATGARRAAALAAARRLLAPSVIPAITGLYLSVALAIGGFGLLLSTIVRNRWASVIFTYFVCLFAWIAPLIAFTMMPGYDLTRVPVGGSLNWLYASPLGAMLSLFNRDMSVAYHHLSLSPGYPGWMVTTAIYASVGCLAAGMAVWLTARERRRAKIA